MSAESNSVDEVRGAQFREMTKIKLHGKLLPDSELVTNCA